MFLTYSNGNPWGYIEGLSHGERRWVTRIYGWGGERKTRERAEERLELQRAQLELNRGLLLLIDSLASPVRPRQHQKAAAVDHGSRSRYVHEYLSTGSESAFLKL